MKPKTRTRNKEPNKRVWKAPRLWSGATCFILGGGPSLNNVNFELIKKYRVIGVNNAYGDPIVGTDGKAEKYIPRDWVDFCWFGDQRWFHWHKKWLRKFPNMVACCQERMADIPGLLALCRGKPEGIETRPKFVSWNKSSGASAINLAYHLGAKTAVLLGYDMRRVNDSANWHSDHPAPHKDPYARFLKPFTNIKRDADRLGFEIINATPESALTLFPFKDLEEIVESSPRKIKPSTKEIKLKPKKTMKRFDFIRSVVREKGYKVGAEVGTGKGNTARHLLSKCPGLFLFQVAFYPETGDQNATKEARKLWTKRIAPHKNHAIVAENSSEEIAKVLMHMGVQLDFVFIDADHTYESVQNDLKFWYPLVKEGGLFCGHDYDHPRFEGVKKAVDEFVVENGIEGLNHDVEKDYMWWVFKEEKSD